MLELLKLAVESAEWNRDNLPENTYAMQVKKIDEERQEVNREEPYTDKWYEEEADYFISLSGTIRFEECFFFSVLGILGFFSNFSDFCNEDLERIKKEIRKKLDIIKKRKYVIIDGVYKHVYFN